MSLQQCVRCGHCTCGASTHWGINTCETERTTKDSDKSQIIASCGGDETQDTKNNRQERDSVTIYQYPARSRMWQTDKKWHDAWCHEEGQMGVKEGVAVGEGSSQGEVARWRWEELEAVVVGYWTKTTERERKGGAERKRSWWSDEAKKHSTPGRHRNDGRIAAEAQGQTDRDT